MRNKARAHWFCKACGKHSYGSIGRAEEALETIAELSNRTARPKRVYPCPYGNGYHLTKQEDRYEADSA